MTGIPSNGEIKELLRSYQESLSEFRPLALATVLRVQGSSYRQPGARMSISENGAISGSVSGGCLERHLIQRALAAFGATEGPRCRVLRYDTTEEGDERETMTSVALGCQGLVEIGLEILPPGARHPALEAIGRTLWQDATETLATLVAAPPGFALSPGSCLAEGLLELPVEFRDPVRADLENVSRPRVAHHEAAQGIFTLLLEKMRPPPRLVVFGASHDSVPLMELGRFLGWQVTVIDCRSAYAVPERLLAGADRLIRCTPGEISRKLILNSRTVCALVTHNFHHDLEILRQLAAAEVGYVGLLGPREKGARVLEALQEMLGPLPGLRKLHSPAGIDLGAEDPQGIALSIIAEAKAVLSGRAGGFLKERQGAIHELVAS